MQLIVPSLLVADALADLAGTGWRRQQGFMQQAQQFHNQWRDFFYPKVFAKQKFGSQHLMSIPRFVFAEESTHALLIRNLQRLGVLLLACVVLFWMLRHSFKSQRGLWLSISPIHTGRALTQLRRQFHSL